MVQPELTSCRLLAFRVAQLPCAIDVDSVSEILTIPLLARPPTTPAILEGFLNLAGTAVPVLRLDRLFGLPEQPIGIYTPLIVLRASAVLAALLVDGIDEVITLSDSTFAPLDDSHSFNGCAKAVVQTGGGPLHLLSIERLLLEQERLCLQQCQSAEQLRLQRLAEAHA